MCGIVGIVHFYNKHVDEAELLHLRDVLTHRGPDSAGMYINTNCTVGLGHRRLAVIDLSPLGQQPMSNEDGSVHVVYNGEIYNFQELREQLRSFGHHFRSRSDTEVIVHAYEEWGDACVEKLSGMFAFAIYDERTRPGRLLLARDRMGEKPLFYIHQDRTLIFASEIHALYRYITPSMEKIDRATLDFYLSSGYVPPDRCLIQGISKLPPAHILTFDQHAMHTQRYWQVQFRPPWHTTLEDYIDELEAKFRQAVCSRLESDVPLGCFLSGGIDSGLITAFAAQASSKPLNTFSVGFVGATSKQDERPLAQLVAEQYSTHHQELEVEPLDHDLLKRLQWHYGEPFADPSALAVFQISKAARQHITVALSGDGGDESFAGYSHVFHAYLAQHARDYMPYPMQRVMQHVASHIPLEPFPKMHRWLSNYVGASSVAAQFAKTANLPTPLRQVLYHPQWLNNHQDSCSAAMWHIQMQQQAHALNDAEVHLYDDLHLRLPGCYLTKVDIASSMVALEIRTPFLDHALVNMVAQIPIHTRLLGLQQKGLLRKLAQRHLPAKLIQQPKRGFAPPVAQWLRGDLAPFLQQVVVESLGQRTGLFQHETIQSLVSQHIQGTHNHRGILWNLLCLEIWLQLFVDRPLHGIGN